MASLLSRFIASFAAAAPVSSLDPLDGECNQMVGSNGAFNGGSTDKKLLTRASDAADPPYDLDQLGAGPLGRWKQNGIEKTRIDNDGSVRAPGLRLIGSPPVILDANGNELVAFNAIASAVNEILIQNAAAGGRPRLAAQGGDANIDLELAAKGTGSVFTASLTQITRGSGNFLRLTASGPGKNWIHAINGSGHMVIGEDGVSNAITIDHTTGIVTFEEVPIGPAANPTTANQLARKEYVDTRSVSFAAPFTIIDPSTAPLSDLVFGTIIIPGGGQYTITKAKVAYMGGSHTSGGSVTFIVQQQGVGTRATLVLNDTNNAINTVYTDDIADFNVSENAILGVLISARSGTVTERNVNVTIEGFRRVF